MSILDNNILEKTDITKYNLPDIDILKYDPIEKKSITNLYWYNKYIFKDIQCISFSICNKNLFGKDPQWHIIMELSLNEKYDNKSLCFIFNETYLNFNICKEVIRIILDKIIDNVNILNKWIEYGFDNSDYDCFSIIKYIDLNELIR